MDDLNDSAIARLKKRFSGLLPDRDESDLESEMIQHRLRQKLTPAESLMALEPGNLPNPQRERLSGEELGYLRNQMAGDLVSGAAGGLNLAPPLAIGAIRKTPTGKLLGTVSREAMELGEAGVKNDLSEQAVQEGLIPYKPEAMQEATKAPKPTNETSFFQGIKDRLEARFGDKQPKGGVIYKTPVSKQGDALVIDTYGRGDVHNAATMVNGEIRPKSKAAWNAPQPFPADLPKIEKALEKHTGPIVLGNKSDPFMWMDSAYGMTKNLLSKMEGKDLTIRTRSDLIARDDYLPLLQKNNTTVEMVFPQVPREFASNPDELVRMIEPGAPSIKRRMKAMSALREAGINVKAVNHPIPREALERVGIDVDSLPSVKARLKAVEDLD